ncbi:hypothetical protein LWI29_016026 [Acer saccharum]|uniref:Formin-like protein n=1 Tax=Acer saccharum TaxID=4024 RepID=A0AA39SB33_ACESA|nr:hypothetical protein LWI29_016026 [Acer saccharum]
MSLLSRFFYRRPPDGLLEFVERVYVFDSCFSTEVLPDGMYQIYLHEILTELHEEFPESSFLAFNFREGEKRSQFAEILCEYDVTVMDYPRQYEGCPLLPMSLIQHFLRVCESWLLLGNHQNIILLHCERGGWPLLAFLLASFLIFRKLHSGERRTLEIVHREAPKGFLQLLSPLNPFPSQLRYLQYISRRNITPEWPPPERALSLDCVILRAIPNFEAQKGCRPMIRIFGRNHHSKGGLSTQMLFSMSKKGKTLRHYHQADCDVIKIDIQCLVQGDVVLECVHLDLDPEREVMMFRVMFNTAFIRSNILMLNSENLDILWDSKERYPKGFRAEVLFGEGESISPLKAPTTILNGEEKGGLPIEAFSRVQELFSGVEWVDNSEDAAFWLLKQLSVLGDVKEFSRLHGRGNSYVSPVDSEEENNASSTADSLDEAFDIFPKSLADTEKLLLSNAADSVTILTENDSLHDVILASEPVDQESLETALSPVHQQSLVPTEGTPPSSPPSPSSRPPLSQEPPPPIPPPSFTGVDKHPPPPPPPLPSYHPSPSLPQSASGGIGLSTFAPPPPPPPPPPPLPNVSKRDYVQPLPPTNKVPPPPPPPPPTFSSKNPSTVPSKTSTSPPVPPPPPPPPFSSSKVQMAPPPPPPPPPPLNSKTSQPSFPPPPPPPPPPPMGTANKTSTSSIPVAPPPPPLGNTTNKTATGSSIPVAPPPPPPPPVGRNPGNVPRPPPPPPAPPSGPARSGAIPPPPPPAPRPSNAPPPPLLNRGTTPVPPPPPGTKSSNVPPPPPPSVGRGKTTLGPTSHGKGRPTGGANNAPKKTSLKPLHWVKVTRAIQGSLWADSPQKQEDQSRAPEIDITELESLFSAASDVKGTNKAGGRRGSNINKSEKVQLVDLRRAYNCEIMLTKIKIPLPNMMNAVLALDSSALDGDQVENLIKFCPTKEEMELLKHYPGDKEMLGKCEQFFLELMKVPRVEAKLRVFSFKITFSSQVEDLRRNLKTINDATREVKESMKLRQIMQTILTLGNALNQGTARGSAVGFKLDSLLKLSDTRARNNKMTLMHYLCKLVAEKMPELLDFDKDLVHLEAASKIQLKTLAEEMQAVSKGLEKVETELTTSENDGAISVGFQKVLKNFLDTAEAEVRSLISLYSEVGRNADSLSQYFGEDPARCPFEQVTQILFVFVKSFNKSREENERLADAEKKKLEKEAMKEKAAANLPVKKDGIDVDKPRHNFQIQKQTL